jgi:hypothetical protein
VRSPIHASTASGAFRGPATASAVPQQRRSDVEALQTKTGGNWLIPRAAPCNSARCRSKPHRLNGASHMGDAWAHLRAPECRNRKPPVLFTPRVSSPTREASHPAPTTTLGPRAEHGTGWGAGPTSARAENRPPTWTASSRRQLQERRAVPRPPALADHGSSPRAPTSGLPRAGALRPDRDRAALPWGIANWTRGLLMSELHRGAT